MCMVSFMGVVGGVGRGGFLDQHSCLVCMCGQSRVQELCESRGGHPGLPVPNSPYGLCGHKATLN